MSNCDGNCNYKRLYEGSQASLNDMAAKQAAALRRVAQLRESVLLSLKQYFPGEYDQAEKQLGKRLSLASDEVVLAYLSGFLSLPSAQASAHQSREAGSGPEKSALASLRLELEGVGVRLPVGNDTSGWSDAIRMWASAKERAQEGAGDFTQGLDSAPQASEAPLLVTPDLLNDLFGEEVGTPEPPQDWDEGGLEDLFGHDDPVSESLDRVEEDDLDDLFSDGSSAPVEFAENIEASGADGAYDQEGEIEAPLLEQKQTSGAGNDSLTDMGRLEGLGDGPVAPEVERPAPKSGQQLGLPGEASVRPEIIAQPARPIARKGRVKKETRVSAVPPQASTDSHDQERGSELDAAVSAMLRQAKPLFTSDLTASGISPQMVADWEEQCRLLGRDAPVRFLVPKARHRERGNLVLPSEAVEQADQETWVRSPWGQCVQDRRLRAARLYELAVMMRLNDGKTKTVEVEDHVVSLRMSANRGMVSVLFVAESELAEGSAAREQAAQALERMLAERSTLIVVATSHNSDAATTRLADGLRQLATQREWKVAVPVTVAHSWQLDVDGANTMRIEALP